MSLTFPDGYTALTPLLGTEKIMAARLSDGKMFYINLSDITAAFVSPGTLTSTLANYITGAVLTSTLTNYITSSAVAQAITAGVASKADVSALAPILTNVKIDATGNLNFSDVNGNVGAVLKSNGTLQIADISIKNQTSPFALNVLTVNSLVTGLLNGNTIIKNDKYALVLTDVNGYIGYGINLDGSVIGSGAETKRISGFMADVNHYIPYGQSLSIGAYGTPIVTTTAENSIYTFFKGPAMLQYDSDATRYSSLVLEVESGTETVCGAMGRMIKQQVIADGFAMDGVTNIYDLLVSAPGMGSQTIAQLSKGTTNYQRFIDGVTNGKSLANAAGKSYNLPAVFWMQGEADQGSDKTTYKNALIKLKLNINTDVKAITGQKNDVVFLNYQMASQNWNNGAAPTIALSLYELTQTSSGFYQGPCLYPYTHSTDQLHLIGNSYAMVGALAGYIMKRIVVDGIDWKPISITDYSMDTSVLNLRFYTPVSPLVIDTTIVTDPGNLGFKIYDLTGTEITITSVSQPRPNTIKIVLPVPVVSGMRLTYGLNGTIGKSGPVAGARGCLRDSQGTTLKYQPAGLNYPLHNWCPMFEKYL
ncbi:sialate O-acetylesterase [Pedobacter sp. L105]|uniref:sialate O-acetylesterase n=1 Tax=Pedobacter sp. L105 TaxID=1641871 RepID=UPI00131ACF09|nr:sialate O-acetylesterase [Pedobacter sp. L105]